MRSPTMRYRCALLLASAVLFAGCGGGGDNGFGGGGNPGIADVTGVIYDQHGNIVRNAQVFYNDLGPGSQRQTISNSNGAYILTRVPALDDLIQCQITSNGVTYFGQNLARLYNGVRTMTMNIAVYPQSQLCSIHGTVSDNFGNLLVGAKIFAVPTSGAKLSSAYGITDFNGNFFIGGLLGGDSYNIQVNGLGYSSAFDTETLAAGQDKQVGYTLPPSTNTTLSPPTNVSAIAYTSPGEMTTNAKFRRAVSAIRNLITPARLTKRVVFSKKNQANGNPIEVDLSWSAINSTSLLGYGIYRSNGSQNLQNIDFLRDPLASVYEDMDGALSVGQSYTYAVTTISTSATNNSGQSPLSQSVSVTPVGDLELNTVAASTQPTFSWLSAFGATTYAIMLFNQYPDVGISDIFDNLQSPVSGTTFQYTGAPLTSGQTYYYVVVGFSPAGSQSISPVGQFTVP